MFVCVYESVCPCPCTKSKSGMCQCVCVCVHVCLHKHCAFLCVCACLNVLAHSVSACACITYDICLVFVLLCLCVCVCVCVHVLMPALHVQVRNVHAPACVRVKSCAGVHQAYHLLPACVYVKWKFSLVRTSIFRSALKASRFQELSMPKGSKTLAEVMVLVCVHACMDRFIAFAEVDEIMRAWLLAVQLKTATTRMLVHIRPASKMGALLLQVGRQLVLLLSVHLCQVLLCQGCISFLRKTK